MSESFNLRVNIPIDMKCLNTIENGRWMSYVCSFARMTTKWLTCTQTTENNPNAPKIFCLGNDSTKSEALAPVISLICDRMNKIINQKGKAKCATIYDEFPTIRVSSVQTLIATGRLNDIVVVLAAQDYSQLKKIYSKEEAETIFNMPGNIAHIRSPQQVELRNRHSWFRIIAGFFVCTGFAQRVSGGLIDNRTSREFEAHS